MGRRLVISDGSLAREISTYKVAVGGVVKQITKACVAQGGVVRQFYPPATTTTTPPEILWTTDVITVSAQETAPLDAVASIVFNRATGQFTYDNDPDASGSGWYLNPPLDGTPGDDTKYLIKVDQVSGTALTGTLATWIDINSLASHIWSLLRAGVGSNSAVATITVAEDNGAGAPEPGTSVAKTVNFSAVVISSGTEGTGAWSDSQRDLVEVKESVDADCILTLNPEGTAVGSADTSGSFNENWHSDTPAVSNPGNFTVNATLVSGTAPTGSALGSNLTLDEVREWTLLATSGENLSCALDVTVNDGVASVTKRVTMNSQRTVAATSNIWSATPSWILDDVWDTGLGPAGVTILVDHVDGLVKTTRYNAPGGESESWHSETPTPSDPENYEARLDILTGDTDDVSGAVGTWINLALGAPWNITATSGEINIWTANLSIRRIGDIAVVKPVRVILAVET